MTDDLRERLDRIARGYEPAASALAGIHGRVRRRAVRRQATAGIAAVVVSASAFAGLWIWRQADRPITPPTTISPTVTMTPPPSASIDPLPSVELSIGVTAQTAGALGDLLARPEGVYVATAGALYTIDPRTGSAAETARADWDPDGVDLTWYGEGTFLGVEGNRVWWFGQEASGAGVGGDVFTFGPATRIADAVFGTSAGEWVAVSDRGGAWELRRLGIHNGQAALDEVPRYPLGPGLHHGDLVGRYLFVSGAWYEPIDYVDPATGHHVDIVGALRIDLKTEQLTSVSSGWGSVAAAGDHVWISHDGWSGCVLAGSLTPCGELSFGGAVAADGRDLWILDGQHLSLVDGAAGVLRGSFDLPPQPSGPARLSAADGHAWVGVYETGTVYRIDLCAVPC